MTQKPDDLEAVRELVKALDSFDPADQERIIRWAREKLGLPTSTGSASPQEPPLPRKEDQPREGPKSPQDIKTFVAKKNPSSDKEFAATVAYYYRFVAPESARRDSITSQDLQEACRHTDRERLRHPGQTLINAHTSGLLDKTGDRGAYAISTVGENLVAVTLPSESTTLSARPAKTSKKKQARKKAGERGRRSRSKGGKKRRS